MPKLTAFEVLGMYGYKNMSIECRSDASVLIAENGAGKTTFISILYALLTANTQRLSRLRFARAVLYFEADSIDFDYNTAFEPPDLGDRPQFKNILNRFYAYGISDSDIFELGRDYLHSGKANAMQTPAYMRIYKNTPYDDQDIFRFLDRLRPFMWDIDYIANFKKEVSHALGDMQILYLPTYRRIEANYEDVLLPRDQPGRKLSRESFDPDQDFQMDELIFFGLSDVESKVGEILKTIQKSMAGAVSQLGIHLIQALGSPSQPELEADQGISNERLQLILNRLKAATQENKLDLNQILTNLDSDHERKKLFHIVLSKLNQAYEESQLEERAINNFIAVVNSYLSPGSISDKILKFDELLLKVELWHQKLGKTLPLDSLSSGEKQIVSIFSRVLLDFNRRYLILIDEPELSLSIDWQRRFLPDLLNADSCQQLIAITHSPFIFDNILDKFEQSIETSIEI